MSENLPDFVDTHCAVFPVIVILSYSTDFIVPVTTQFWVQTSYQDSRNMRGFCISGIETTVMLRDENSYKLIKMSGSLEDRCKAMGTSMEEAFPTVTRISKEEWESYIYC